MLSTAAQALRLARPLTGNTRAQGTNSQQSRTCTLIFGLLAQGADADYSNLDAHLTNTCRLRPRPSPEGSSSEDEDEDEDER